MKTNLKILFLGSALFITNLILAQSGGTPPNNVDWSTIDTEVGSAKTSMIQIVGHIVGIILAIAFAYTLWKVATGKQDSKESLIALGGGLALYIIAYALGFL
ncbi:MAG: hypothetical protein HS119_11215 [Flavobacteriales bacterium]|nr:hypothetical protein [Flavobacteriales bacterium]